MRGTMYFPGLFLEAAAFLLAPKLSLKRSIEFWGREWQWQRFADHVAGRAWKGRKTCVNKVSVYTVILGKQVVDVKS